MAIGFPPLPVFPNAIDNDYTLFLVHNTSEALLTANNQAWSSEVAVQPVAVGETEIWSNNGFATLEGELFYYDAVKKNISGKVERLIRCARGLGGSAPRFVGVGSCVYVRGFVIAEHHNQLVDTITNIEKFVGINFDPDCATLDRRIRTLDSLPPIFDDFSCPDVNFSFVTTEDDPASGTLISYSLTISGFFTSFRLDFGDGAFTTSVADGTHRYAPNSTIDPIISISNDRCEILQTNIFRDEPIEPEAAPADEINIVLPEIPEPIDFLCPEIGEAEAQFTLPPTVFPCLTLETPLGDSTFLSGFTGFNIPSKIEVTGLENFTSVISFTEINIPSFIDSDIPSIISIVPSIPAVISIEPPIPPVISIEPPIPSVIHVVGFPETFSFAFLDSPKLDVNWGAPPLLDFNVNLVGLTRTNRKNQLKKDLGEEFDSLFENDDTIDIDGIGIPSEIKIIAPDGLRFDKDIPSVIELTGTIIPSKIEMDERFLGIPSVILVDVPTPIPSVIAIDGTGIPDKIQVVGFPSSIELRGPSEIMLRLPDNIEVPLVYKGDPIKVAPIDVKIQMDVSQFMGTDEDDACFKLIPCKPK